MARFSHRSEGAVLEMDLLKSGAPEGADCILTGKQFRERYGVVLESSSQEPSSEEEQED